MPSAEVESNHLHRVQKILTPTYLQASQYLEDRRRVQGSQLHEKIHVATFIGPPQIADVTHYRDLFLSTKLELAEDGREVLTLPNWLALNDRNEVLPVESSLLSVLEVYGFLISEDMWVFQIILQDELRKILDSYQDVLDLADVPEYVWLGFGKDLLAKRAHPTRQEKAWASLAKKIDRVEKKFKGLRHRYLVKFSEPLALDLQEVIQAELDANRGF